jgi:hypothetical protein
MLTIKPSLQKRYKRQIAVAYFNLAATHCRNNLNLLSDEFSEMLMIPKDKAFNLAQEIYPSNILRY